MRYEATILIAEDEPKTRNGIQKTLEQWSQGRLRILTAENGFEALDVMEREPIHLLITDIRMPGMSGLQLIQRLRERQIDASAILVSGYAEFEYAREAIELQVMTYLLKPIEKAKLLSAAEQALTQAEQRKLQRKIEQIVDPKLIAAETGTPLPGPVREAIEFVHRGFDQQIGLKETAEHIHMNASYVSSLFKDHLGITFSDYLTRYRIQKAKEFLVSTPLSVNEISERVGYVTAKYFIKIFREHEGMTPSEYRKSIRNDDAR